MRVAEIYKSIQGEGRLTGTESVFLRTSGCNLRCWFCDTRYASWEPEGDDASVDEIWRRITALDASHVVITGGEPMLFAELLPLCDRLKHHGMHVTIETAGTLYLPVACDLMSISPKLDNSTPSSREAGTRWRTRHELTREAPEVIRRLVAEYDYQFKFVIDVPTDIDEVDEYLLRYSEIGRDRVWMMPQGRTAAEAERVGGWLERVCLDRGWRFCPRMQLQWFGAVRGT